MGLKVAKTLLAVAIAVVLFKVLTAGRRGAWGGARSWGGGAGPQPFSFKRRDYYDDGDDMDDMDADAAEEGYEDEEYDEAEEGYAAAAAMGGGDDDAGMMMDGDDAGTMDGETEGFDDWDNRKGFKDHDEHDVDYGTVNPGRGFGVATNLMPRASGSYGKGGASSFAEFAPKAMRGQNFLNPVSTIGVDTQGSSNKNPSYDLRREPPNPRMNVGPWSNSTIDADLLRKPLE